MEKNLELRETFSRRLKAARSLRKERQTDVVKRTRISSQALCDYEAGRRTPTVERLVTLAKSLRVSTDYLLGISNTPIPQRPNDDSLVALIDALNEDEQKLMIKIIRVTTKHIAQRQHATKKRAR
jgi:transcriptional regulator with XRE-family HTH domain